MHSIKKKLLIGRYAWLLTWNYALFRVYYFKKTAIFTLKNNTKQETTNSTPTTLVNT
ncbi:hypothetical protein [Corallibacter sp.]|uniref:hypothetical protein n=1 Tax=Corallibacter sp. TaxID=2038084 RepID=UPI003A90D0F0